MHSVLCICYSPDMSNISVRDLDPKLWRQFRAAALSEGVTAGQLLNRVIAEWLADQKAMDEEMAS